MGIKKKLTNGALAATMGLALVGGGTFAAFNDVEALDNHFAAGTLDLSLAGSEKFQLSDLKPGDYATRTIKMKNAGSLAIKDVLLSIDSVKFIDGEPGDSDMGDNESKYDYLDQFLVTVLTVGAEGDGDLHPLDIIEEDDGITLADIYRASEGKDESINKIRSYVAANHVMEDGRINIATVNPDRWTGIPKSPNDPDNVILGVKFKDNTNKVKKDGYYKQNKFQGDSANVTFTLEARQWGGLDVRDSDLNDDGSIKTNKKSYSEEGNPKRPE
ncbi:TasA family protein [Halobacillus hunanensis]|uniref:TasA family protein n=1 Tax=Halobacillus hunanensis TaxID=578214 RepID=UPI0015906CF8|nr:TasA family protein [Halobacillus hunanensis]